MNLEFNQRALLKLMKDFYLLTKLRIVLFDAQYQELLAYPNESAHFCLCMKSNPATKELCTQSDLQSFQNCRSENKLNIYHCHAGLIEACAPLIEDNVVIGYMMFGQVSDFPGESLLNRHLNNYLEGYAAYSGNDIDWSLDIPLKSQEQIHAAAQIMEACTFYVILKDTVKIRRQNYITNMRSFLLEHLSEDLSVSRLTSELGISRSKLYQSCEMYLGKGIAAYIYDLRLEKARQLLADTDLPITEISEHCGYSDYNYFCRIFKKENGLSAKKYRSYMQQHNITIANN